MLGQDPAPGDEGRQGLGRHAHRLRRPGHGRRPGRRGPERRRGDAAPGGRGLQGPRAPSDRPTPCRRATSSGRSPGRTRRPSAARPSSCSSPPGPQKVAVPERRRADARTARARRSPAPGFTVTVTQQEDAKATPGTVLSQSPAAGTQADKGSAVTIVVAKAAGARSACPNVVGRGRGDRHRHAHERRLQGQRAARHRHRRGAGRHRRPAGPAAAGRRSRARP